MAALICILLAALAALLAFPGEALAWGPGVHLAIGNQLLHAPEILGPKLTALLAAHPQAFLYGALSADIFVGKGCQAKPGHSHNWETAHALIEHAESPEQRSYALGYATHLAADVMAHNYYVPTMLGMTPGGGKLSHVLVEMQADRRVRWSGSQAKGLFRLPDAEAQDAFLLQATRVKRWNFLLKKQLYRGSVHLSGRRELDKPLSRLRRMLPVVPQIGGAFLEQPGSTTAEALVWRNWEYLQLMLDLSLVLAREAVLQPGVCLARQFDPVGSENLAALRRLRRERSGSRIIPPGELFPLHPSLERFALDLAELKDPQQPPLPHEMDSLRNVKSVELPREEMAEARPVLRFEKE